MELTPYPYRSWLEFYTNSILGTKTSILSNNEIIRFNYKDGNFKEISMADLKANVFDEMFQAIPNWRGAGNFINHTKFIGPCGETGEEEMRDILEMIYKISKAK